MSHMHWNWRLLFDQLLADFRDILKNKLDIWKENVALIFCKARSLAFSIGNSFEIV